LIYHYVYEGVIYVHYFLFRFCLEEISSQNQVKASVQRRIRQSIQDEVCLLFHLSFSPS